MSLLFSFAISLTAIFFISLSFLTRDETVTQINLVLGTVISLVSFLFSSLWIKLVMVLVLLMSWRYISARLSILKD